MGIVTGTVGAVLPGRVGEGMALISYARHQFPPVVIQHAVWLYLRFTLSYRDVEDLLAERGLDISYETVRRWVLKFGAAVRTTAAGAAPATELAVAPGRDGSRDRRQAHVPLARGR